jgi:hypothetical protein
MKLEPGSEDELRKLARREIASRSFSDTDYEESFGAFFDEANRRYDLYGETARVLNKVSRVFSDEFYAMQRYVEGHAPRRRPPHRKLSPAPAPAS